MVRLVKSVCVFVFFVTGSVASANGPIFQNYRPDNIQDALDSGKTVVVAFHGFWCSPCKKQFNIMEEARRENPQLNRMSFFMVDWDEYQSMPVAFDRDVTDDATLLVMDQNKEIARMVRVTFEDAIKGFLELGLEW
ncbi:MAG: thioredoxin family protein [Pseudomonadota bacterium]